MRLKSELYKKEQEEIVDKIISILDLNILGVSSQKEYKRFYPAGEVTAQLVGFTDINDNGQEGMELAYDTWLTGEAGAKKVV